MTGLVDFHCHLDLYRDYTKEIHLADEAGVFTLAVTTTPRAWPRNFELTKHLKHVHAALGLHPQLVAEHETEITLWDKYLSETRYVGEVGLDAGPRFFKSLEAQKRVFRHILQCCAKEGNKIISVHSVRAVKTVLDYIETYLPVETGKVVLHWFTGTKSEVKRSVDLGCYFSINAPMLANDRQVSMIQTIPLDRILTETDGPFTQTNNRPTEPTDVALVVRELGRLHRLPSEQLALIVRNNLRTLML